MASVPQLQQRSPVPQHDEGVGSLARAFGVVILLIVIIAGILEATGVVHIR